MTDYKRGDLVPIRINRKRKETAILLRVVARTSTGLHDHWQALAGTEKILIWLPTEQSE